MFVGRISRRRQYHTDGGGRRPSAIGNWPCMHVVWHDFGFWIQKVFVSFSYLLDLKGIFVSKKFSYRSIQKVFVSFDPEGFRIFGIQKVFVYRVQKIFVSLGSIPYHVQHYDRYYGLLRSRSSAPAFAACQFLVFRSLRPTTWQEERRGEWSSAPLLHPIMAVGGGTSLLAAHPSSSSSLRHYSSPPRTFTSNSIITMAHHTMRV